MNPTRKTDYADWIGIAASALCTLHCLLTPVVFAAKPFLVTVSAGHSHGPAFWSFLDYVFLALSLLAIWYAVGHAANSFMKIALWIFWGLFAAGLLMESNEIMMGKWLMYAGSFALIMLHLVNYHQHKHRLSVLGG
jgi:hypothetical protein